MFLPPLGILIIKNLLFNHILFRQLVKISLENIFQEKTLSHVLINFILNGLETVIYKSIYFQTKYKFKRVKRIKNANVNFFFSLNIIRYANKFIMICINKWILKNLVLFNLKQFVKERGLQLSFKTIKLFRLKDGFKLKFLGYIFQYNNFQKKKNKYLCLNFFELKKKIVLYPNKSNFSSFLNKLKFFFYKALNFNASSLIIKINPILKN